MARYTGDPVRINRAPADVFARIANIGAYQQYIDMLPEEAKAKIGNVKFTDDSIIISAAPIGDVALKLIEKIEHTRLRFEAQGAPVPLSVDIALADDGNGVTKLEPAIDVEVPAMLKPFVAPKMQEAANQMGRMLGNLFSAI